MDKRRVRSEKLIGTIGSAAVGLSFLVAVSIFVEMLSFPAGDRQHIVHQFEWISGGSDLRNSLAPSARQQSGCHFLSRYRFLLKCYRSRQGTVSISYTSLNG